MIGGVALDIAVRLQYCAVLAAFEAVELLIDRLGFDDARTKQSIYFTMSLLLNVDQHIESRVAASFLQACCSILLMSRAQSKHLLAEKLDSRFASQKSEANKRVHRRRDLSAELLASPIISAR
jgi:hypothetical protein